MASLSVAGKSRLKRELTMLQTDPPPGVTAYLESDDDQDLTMWRAEIVGPQDSPFAEGIFELTIRMPARYPFEPPSCRFVGDVMPFHPNIDSSGRICLDTLKSQPSGSWSPAVSLPSLLLSLRSLLAEPNPDDGLVMEISNMYRNSPEQWKSEAQKRTREGMASKTTRAANSKKRTGSSDGHETATKKSKSTVTKGL